MAGFFERLGNEWERIQAIWTHMQAMDDLPPTHNTFGDGQFVSDTVSSTVLEDRLQRASETEAECDRVLHNGKPRLCSIQ